MSDQLKPRGGGRPRKGSLEFRGKTWHARLTVTIDGESVRKWFDLGTDNKAVATRKLARLSEQLAAAESPSPESVKARETIDSYAEAWLASRKARGVASAVPYSRQSIMHIRAVLFRLFDSAWRDELIAENPIARVSVPEMEQSSKARAMLTDEEIVLLVAHPKVDSEIKLLVLLSRTVAGLRAGDLNTLDWTAFGPDYATCTFVRRKTRKKRPRPETHVVPETVRLFLKAWHADQRREGEPNPPGAGPVFPVRRGERAGQAKKRTNMSYADRLRRELVTAGINRHELHHETATTLPVDFHSTRRAYATALVRSGARDRETMKLGGWSSPQLITRYDETRCACCRHPRSRCLRCLPGFAPPQGQNLQTICFARGPIPSSYRALLSAEGRT